jgi:hypothetical protein
MLNFIDTSSPFLLKNGRQGYGSIEKGMAIIRLRKYFCAQIAFFPNNFLFYALWR